MEPFAYLVLWSLIVGVFSTKIIPDQPYPLFVNTPVAPACEAALNSNIDCPGLVEKLLQPDWAVEGINNKALESLCSSSCLEDIESLSQDLAEVCKDDIMRMQIGNLSVADVGQVVKERTDLLCLRETDPGGRFCHEVISSWNITALGATKNLTWPQNSEKCFFNTKGDCLTLDDMLSYSQWIGELPQWESYHNPNPPVKVVSLEDAQVTDFFTNRSRVLLLAEHHSLGADTHLAWDEYPLEIQCSRCFWKNFAIGHQSQWTHMIWDEWAEQTWANMVRNCKIPDEESVIVPVVNSTGIVGGERDDEVYTPSPEIMWEYCPATALLPKEYDRWGANMTRWYLEHSVASACVQNWNPWPWFMEDEPVRMCVPRPCELAVVPDNWRKPNVMDYVEEKLGNITVPQFLRWNPCLDINGHIMGGDTVCVSPPGGVYKAEVGVAATPAFWAVKATPSTEAALGTVQSCGRYHVVTGKEACAYLSVKYGITVDQFRRMNPSIDSRCQTLTSGRSYCVAMVDGAEPPDIMNEFYREQLWKVVDYQKTG